MNDVHTLPLEIMWTPAQVQDFSKATWNKLTGGGLMERWCEDKHTLMFMCHINASDQFIFAQCIRTDCYNPWCFILWPTKGFISQDWDVVLPSDSPSSLALIKLLFVPCNETYWESVGLYQPSISSYFCILSVLWRPGLRTGRDTLLPGLLHRVQLLPWNIDITSSPSGNIQDVQKYSNICNFKRIRSRH